MAEAVGGAFLSAFFDVVFDRLASPEVANLIRGKKLDPKLLERLRTTLRVVRAVLNDAEKKLIRDSDVNRWLDDLRDAVYVADDLLDEVSTKAATQKEVSNLFSSLFNVQDREMVSQLEDIVERLESILKLKEILDLKEIAVENLSYRTPSTSLQDGSHHIYGRDQDKEAIIKLLLDDNSDGEEVSVIPIVGMGGVGKTTLAQMVYNDEDLKEIFDLKAWICVSEQFDILKVTKTITEAVTRRTCEMNDLNLLHLDLQAELKGKKFLIVLDDVWIEDYDNWNLLKRPFQCGIRGSKILVTTRSEDVASLVHTVQDYNLNLLSNEDCWLVFTNHACFSPGSSENTTGLEKIGREIVKKCKGLPLAAQSLGGLLRRKHDIRYWNNILNSDLWEESKIIPALRISYHYLPPHLKRCFVYCSIYPKDFEFEKNDLVLLWMAEDLLPLPSKGKTLEEVGYEYFDYLVSRSFFQRSSDPWEKSFVMHDLLHDLATFLGGEFYFRSEEAGDESKISTKTRHLSFTQFSGLLENCEAIGTVKFLRTFLPLNFTFDSFNNTNAPWIMLLLKVKHLRVLSFCEFQSLDAVPDSIGELMHLRHLDLSMTSIKALPESLGNLYNLQTLKLYDCSQLTVLPNSMQNLVNLRYFDIDGTPLKEMPKGMGKLNQLQHLSYYIVGKHKENGIMELGGLSNLHGSLSIKNLDNVTNSSEASGAKMTDKKFISRLYLTWSSTDYCINSQTEMDILCKLQPNQDLQFLTIGGYRGTRFPDWVGNSSFHNMTDLILSSCKNCCILPSLGQLPSLKKLSILQLDALVTIDDSFYKDNNSSLLNPFPSLESLQFHYMPCWEVWSLIEPHAFPRLKWLEIGNCPKLRGDLPSHLPALERLTIRSCMQLAFSLPRAPAIRHLEIIESNAVGLQELPLSIESRSMHNSCDSLTFLPLEAFPNLKYVRIRECENLESFSVSEDSALQNLSSLEIVECPNLVSFHTEGLPMPNMTSFVVSRCDKLKSLPQQMNTLLPKLEHLRIENCSDIGWFPEGVMPPSLGSIFISNCEKLVSGLAWPSMDMLTHVNIGGPCDGIKSFPKEGLLPASLTSLHLYRFSSLETLDCKGLLHLTTLQQLTIGRCQKLKNIAGERLPTSLTELQISGCPLLGEQCCLKHPQIWDKISHIHHIVVDGGQIS